METKFYYIHGLNSSKNSKKFLELKKQYHNIECFDWNINDNIDNKLHIWLNIINKLDNSIYENVCIIASSTGANFACQLRKLCKSYFLQLVLINPLFDIHNIYDTNLMPKKLRYYIEKIIRISDSLILIAENDEVINNVLMENFIVDNNKIIIDKKSSHKFEKLNSYYNEIDTLINNNIHL